MLSSQTEPSPDDPRVRAAIDRYWRSNRRITAVLLVAWAVISLGCGVLFADVLGRFAIGGAPLGFWIAQQGAILAFVLMILVYALLMARLDRQHRRELAAIANDAEGPS